MKNNISDQFLVEVTENIKSGKLDPAGWKVYVFEMSDSTNAIGIKAPDKAAAEQKLKDMGRRVLRLIRIEPQTYNGLTYTEVMAEVNKRNLGGK